MRRRWPSRSPKVVKDIQHQFLYFLCKMFGKLPDDSFFDEMDPVHKLWLYESWIMEQEKEAKKDKYLGILIGSFTNPEAAQKMIKVENPDFELTEEEAELTAKQLHAKIVEEEQQVAQANKKRKRRRKLIRD